MVMPLYSYMLGQNSSLIFKSAYIEYKGCILESQVILNIVQAYQY